MVENWKTFLKKCELYEGMILLLFLSLPFLGYVSHPTVLLTAIVCIIQGAWLWQIIKGKRRICFAPIDTVVILLASAFFLSGALTPGARAAFFEGLVRALLLLLYFPSVDFFRRPIWRKRGAFALQCAGGFAAFLGILQYFLGKAQLKWVDLDRFSDIGGRVTGGFENPNVFSVYLLLVLPLSLVSVFERDNPFCARLFSAICLLSEILCLIFTWSRGAWLGAILSIFLFFLFFSRRTRRCLMIGALPLLLLSFYLPRNIVNRFQSIGNLNESSIRYRLFVWRGVLRMICDHPFGIGLGMERFSEQYLPYAVKGTETVIHTHQIFLQILCEIGSLGLILCLIFLGLLICKLLPKALKDHRDDDVQCFGGGMAMLGTVTAGLFDNIWYHYGVFCLFWIMAALSTSGFEREKSKKCL